MGVNVKHILLVLALTGGMLNMAIAAEGDENGGSAPSLSGVEIYPLSDLQPGLQGTGYTVIRGTEIESFNVEVLELIPDGGFDGGPMVLARFSGAVVDFSDGIAGGYSGSPVYIDNKLVGAVSMAMPFTDTHIGGITPISRMLKSLPDYEELDVSEHTVLPPAENSGVPIEDETTEITFVRDYEAARRHNDAMRAAGARSFAAVPAVTPVYFAGISPAVIDQFGDQLQGLLGKRLQLMDVPMGHAGDQGLFLRQEADMPGLFLYERSAEPPLKPGDACAVTFVEGDVELYGIGTVTYSDDGGRFLLFGHMMMGEGDSQFPIGKAYITWVHGSILRAFKQGVRLNTLGTITKDHAAGCGGSFEIEPDMIPVRLKIRDVDLDREETMRFKVVRHKDFTPLLIAMAMSQASSEVLDRQPGGTLKLSYHVEGVGLKEPMRRTNFYYDERSVLFNGAFELMPIADLLENNIYRQIKIDKIEIMAEITRNRVNASIDDAEFILDEEEEEKLEITSPEEIQNLEEIAQQMIESANADSDDGEEQIEKPLSVTVPEWRYRPSPDVPGSSRLGAGGRHLTPLYRAYRGSPQQQDPNQPEEQPEGPMPPGMAEGEYMTEEIPTFAPGDTIRVKVRLQPFRTDEIWREFSITVPEDFPSGSSMLYIHGGGDLMSWDELGGKGRSLWGFGPIIDTREFDLDSIIQQIVEAPLNNELLLTLTRPYEYQDPTQIMNGENGNSNGSQEEEEEPEDHIDEVYQMEWVIYNSYMLPLNIQSDEDLAAMEEEMANGEEDDNGETEDEDNGDEEEEEYESVLPF